MRVRAVRADTVNDDVYRIGARVRTAFGDVDNTGNVIGRDVKRSA